MQPQSPPAKTSKATIIFLLLLTMVAVWFVLNRQFVIDFARGYSYKPSSSIISLENELGLTDEGKRLFAASQPQLESASDFNSSCNQKSETNNPILGCYVNQGIYIFDVTNQKLAGIEQTTAAHELLHAAYERMSDSERQTIDTALRSAYQANRTDELAQRMSFYQRTEPGEEANELHSILGTEFNNLGDVLENHYKKYFTSRAKIVAYNKQYNDVFTSISNRLKQLTEAINTSVASINERIRLHNQAVKQLNADQQAFVAKNQRGGFKSTAEFNAEQQNLNTRATVLNTERDKISLDIDASDKLRTEYNQLAQEYNQLNQSIDSSVAPKPTLES
jgi:uncharacterized membrane protein